MKKIMFVAVTALFLASCGGSSVKDKAQEWCDCVKENGRDNEKCTEMIKKHMDGMSNEDLKEYAKAQEECLKEE